MKYFASCSFGKDSIATILLALEHNEPLDGVVFSEVMFDHSRGISGEIPEHIEWINNVAIPRLEAMGVNVYKVRSRYDYVQLFTRVRTRGKCKGKSMGFLMGGKCEAQIYLKIKPIKDFYKSVGEDVSQYVGIAIDEPNRLKRLKENQISLLDKYGYTEQMAKQLCEKYELLSPIYNINTRGGCWFCPNRRWKTLMEFRMAHNDLWGHLAELSKTSNLGYDKFKWGISFDDVNKKLDMMQYNEEHQLKLQFN